jgi:hypothetical protein
MSSSENEDFFLTEMEQQEQQEEYTDSIDHINRIRYEKICDMSFSLQEICRKNNIDMFNHTYTTSILLDFFYE